MAWRVVVDFEYEPQTRDLLHEKITTSENLFGLRLANELLAQVPDVAVLQPENSKDGGSVVQSRWLNAFRTQALFLDAKMALLENKA
ncbi:MAG: hypothetical protein WD825_03635 [Gemmatimonadaceae bacterium]